MAQFESLFLETKFETIRISNAMANFHNISVVQRRLKILRKMKRWQEKEGSIRRTKKGAENSQGSWSSQLDIVPRSSDYEWHIRASYTNSIGTRIESSILFVSFCAFDNNSYRVISLIIHLRRWAANVLYLCVCV